MKLKIPFRGLKEGKHEYEFIINDKFFEQYSEGDIHKGQLIVQMTLIKRSTGLEAIFDLNGHITISCHRCLDDFIQAIKYSGKLYFEHGDKNEEISDELITLSGSENYLELDQYIYEFIVLSLPLKIIHSEDENGKSLCNKEMLKMLSSINTSKEEEDKIEDPRWDKLKGLIN